MNKYIILFLILAIPTLAAQEIEFGNISREALIEKEYLNDKEANAVVLYKDQNTYYTYSNGISSLVTDFHERIKIYNKEGFEHATKTINLFKTNSANEKYRKLKAYTYTLENDQIVTTELADDQIFENELSFNYDQIRFTMPNVKEGSIIEFKYQVSSPFIWNIDEFRFQKAIPIQYLKAQIRTPKGFTFKKTSKGYLSFYAKENTMIDHRVGMEMIVNTFTLHNIPALKDEVYVDNMDNYRAGVMFELVSIEIPGQASKSYAQSWSDVAKSIGSTSDYKTELGRTGSFDNEIDELLAGVSDKTKKLKLILKFVKEKTEWNGRDGKYLQNGFRKTMKERKGNVADINLLLVAMLRYAGINANPLIISTKDNSIPLFPTLDRLNYVIAHAQIDDKVIYLDATEEFSDLNLLPIKDYNFGGVLVDNENLVWKKISAFSPVKALRMYSMKANLSDDGNLSGDLKSRLTNHAAFEFRKNIKNQDLDTFLEQRESELGNIEIDDYRTKNADATSGAVQEFFHFNLENAADVIDDKIYIKPLTFLGQDENPFKIEKRDFPIDFGFAFHNKYIIELNLPEDYEVESLPKNMSARLPDQIGKYRFIYDKTSSGIELSVIFEINKAIVWAQSYLDVKEFFNQFITKSAEQIVLKKITNGNTESAAGGR